MKYLLTPLILVFSFCQTNAQDKLFHLDGTINVDTGKVVLLQTGGREYYPASKNQYEAKTRNGVFSFTGQIRYPHSFRILIRPNYVSDYFMVESGSQRIVCNVDSNREMPELDNKIMLTERAVLHARKVRLLSYTNTVSSFEA
ncbi:MAG: DUF4369 domain-containing protein [Spirosoma sp.]|nr:DUF4369 domain-containing protein [Spirosoma sp.]